MKKSVIRAQQAALRLNHALQSPPSALSGVQLDLLFAIAASEEPLRPSDLASRLGATRSQVAKGLTPLLAQAYVTKTPDATDRRSYTLMLTKRGAALTEGTLAAQYYNAMTEVMTAMGKKQFNKFVHLLELATDNGADRKTLN